VAVVWETPELALDAIQEFLTGVRRAVAPDRMLATVLFTDIVGSTQRAGDLGDQRWRELLEVHDQAAARWVEAFHGRLVKTTGDGILATFDSPARAIRCAAALGEDLHGMGIQIRAGLHTGEIELRHGDVGDVALAGHPGGEPSQDRSWRRRSAQPLPKVHGQLDGWRHDQFAHSSPGGRPPGIGEQAQRQGIHGT
jgi:class 3 adenylate cyclase